MYNIRTGNDSNITTGNNSGIVKIKGNNNDAKTGDFSKNTTYREKAGWFFSGFILPLMVGLLVEFISKGTVSDAFGKILELFK